VYRGLQQSKTHGNHKETLVRALEVIQKIVPTFARPKSEKFFQCVEISKEMLAAQPTLYLLQYCKSEKKAYFAIVCSFRGTLNGRETRVSFVFFFLSFCFVFFV